MILHLREINQRTREVASDARITTLRFAFDMGEFNAYEDTYSAHDPESRSTGEATRHSQVAGGIQGDC